MKGLGRVVVGSISGGLLGAAAFFAVDGLLPANAEAQAVGIHVTDFLPDIKVELTDFLPDKRVQVVGRCSSDGDTRVEVTDFLPNERWEVTDFLPDMQICLSGDIEEWLEQAN